MGVSNDIELINEHILKEKEDIHKYAADVLSKFAGVGSHLWWKITLNYIIIINKLL